jgi:hypothetical protein
MGQRYLELFTDEKQKLTLVKLLSDTPINQLEQQITVDYQSGNTVLLNGWLLSKTEARQCALFSLSKASDHAY